jgi:hypothetical protein
MIIKSFRFCAGQRRHNIWQKDYSCQEQEQEQKQKQKGFESE